METTRYAFRLYILGHEAYYRPDFHLHFFGELDTEAGSLAQTLARTLGVEIVQPEAAMSRTELIPELKREIGWC
ncbi:MAG: hypothetical protein LC650_03805 [Actinobacteria bacterium]|nr:hypothetical protein [Actinomycetota bacterium]